MRLCLDTHAFLWLIAMPARLGASLATLRDEAHELLVSAVVPWEIAVKSSLGKLEVPQPVVSTIPGLIRDIGARALSIEHADASRSRSCRRCTVTPSTGCWSRRPVGSGSPW